MKSQFSFLSQPHISALEHAIHLLPGLNRVDLIWLNPESNELALNSISSTEEYPLPLEILSKEQKTEILKFRKSIKSMAWVEASELPYDENRLRSDMNLFDEALKSILCLGFPSDMDGHANVFVFYFRKDTSEFGPVSKESLLDTNQKKIMGPLIYNSLKTILSHHEENRNTMMDYNRNIGLMVQSLQQKLSKAEKKNALIEGYLNQALEGIVKSLSAKGDHIKLSEEVKESLRPHIANRDLVKDIIMEAITFIKTLHFGIPIAEFTITNDHLRHFDQYIEKPEAKHEQANNKYDTQTKTYQFLDALEQAAFKVSQQGGKLTSVRVGALLEQPVTAAAISDKLKNHSRKILLLLKQYPDNWSLIRNRFRPIINIQEKLQDTKVA